MSNYFGQLHRFFSLVLETLPHVDAAGDELAEALLVRECVAGAQGARAVPHERLAMDVRVLGARLELLDALPQPDAVGQRGGDARRVEAVGDHGHDQHRARQQQAQPEAGRREDGESHAHVRVVDAVRVERQDETEVVDDATPDHKVIETSPVRRVQSTLEKQRIQNCFLISDKHRVFMEVFVFNSVSIYIQNIK